MQKFTSEASVRKIVAAQLKRKIRWVEPTRGSTFGIPDGFIVLPAMALGGHAIGVTVWVELKLGWMGENDGESVLLYSPRREQKRQIRKMVEEGVPVFFLVGLENSDGLWAINCVDRNGCVAENALAGVINLGSDTAWVNGTSEFRKIKGEGNGSICAALKAMIGGIL